MLKVYILIWSDIDMKETVILGAFSTLEKAQVELKAQIKSVYYDYRIEEYMVQ